MISFSHLIDEKIKPELENVFGPALTSRIIITARAKANAPIVGMTKDDFERFIEAISADDRVQGMWGNAGTQERKKRWKEAVKVVGVSQ
ncbi:MAG: hypothetical protein AB1632_06440 [Nitrospirota bacterium]